MSCRAWVLASIVLVSSSLGGCVPRGDPPPGRQILADSTAQLVQMLPSIGDGLLRVLFFRPGDDAMHVNLWVLAVDPAGGPAAERLLWAGLPWDDTIGYRPAARGPQTSLLAGGGFSTDARGRIFLVTQTADSDDPASGGLGLRTDLVRIDPVTGASRDFGSGAFGGPPLWEDGERLMLLTTAGPVLYEEDGGATVLGKQTPAIAGDSAYYLTNDGDLMRLAPGQPPQQLAAGLYNFFVGNAQTLLLTRAVPDPDMPGPVGPTGPRPARVTASILDTTTLQETPLPDGPSYVAPQFSSDARWIATTSGAEFVIIDRTTNAVEAFRPSTSSGHDNPIGWRLGHAELWGSTFHPELSGLDKTSVWIKKPAQPVVTVPAAQVSGFTPDGAYWISPSVPIDSTAPQSELIGSGDDPTGPRRPLVPAGTSKLDLWQLDDARLVVLSQATMDSFEKYYIQLVDPSDGATTVLGQNGDLAAVGKTRLLGLFDVAYERGDLTTIDFATAQQTIVAHEFAMSAVTEPQGGDDFPPGGRLVYLFRARFPSPWDGLWLTTVP